MLDPFRPENPDDVAYLKSLQSDIHEQFIDYVRRRRGTRLQGEEEELFSGCFWTGRQAQKLGLIDQIGLLHDVLETRFGKEVKLVTIVQKRGLLPLGAGMADQQPISCWIDWRHAAFGNALACSQKKGR